jgi:apolipoprotein N-acyltransferase
VDKHAGYTLYALLGDWAVVLCALLVLATSLPAALRRRK